MTENKLDIVIFGATGYTGQYVVESLIKTIDKERHDISWGIAGRREDKLRLVIEDVSKYLGKNLDDIPIIVADVAKEESILQMCKRARLILNCVGPYHLYGRVVVKSCIATGTHHLDLAGEPTFLEGTQIDFDEKAKDAGILIVGACGFDSIPVDLGIEYLKDKFKGELAHVKTYASMKSGPSGYVLNHGTWDSGLYAVANWREMRDIKRKLYQQFFKRPFPKFKHSLEQKYIPHYPDEIGNLTVPFWDTDKFVARRTQLYNYIEKNERPIQVASYFVLGSWFIAMGLVFIGLLFLFLAQFKFGVELLENYPSLFTFGRVSKNGPTREQVSEASFQFKLVGKGWPEKLANPTDEPADPPNKTIVARIRGPEAGYAATSMMMVQAGLTVLLERDAIPFKGGVLTPGLVFRHTSLIDRLRRYNITFDIIKSD